MSVGGGADTILLSNFADVIHIDGSDNADSFADLSGLNANNRLLGIEVIKAMGGDDIVDLSSPLLSALQQGFTVEAGSGSDIVFGSSHNDLIQGGNGNDTLVAGPGDNTLTGGAGADTYIFSHLTGSDTITDFNPSEDNIKVLTSINDRPSTSKIQKLDTGYQWNFGPTELTLTVLEGTIIEVEQLNINFDLV